MENKKTKLTISGIAKKSIKNIELAKTQGKNSVVIEKKTNKFPNRGGFTRSASPKNKPLSSFNKNSTTKPVFTPKPSTINSDFEKRKLAEQRATKRLKGETAEKDKKSKLGSKTVNVNLSNK